MIITRLAPPQRTRLQEIRSQEKPRRLRTGGKLCNSSGGASNQFYYSSNNSNHHDIQLQALESSTGDGGANRNHELRLRTDSDVLAGEFPAGELIPLLHPIDFLADVMLYIVYRE